MSTLMDNFLENNAMFSRELFSNIAKDPTKNIIISPLSVQTCVALSYSGASGETAHEIVKGLRLVSDQREEVAASFAEFLQSYRDNRLVKIANNIYINQNYKLKESFKEISGKYFNSEAETINVANPTAAADKINKWVEDKTNNKIKNLISPDNIVDDTRIVLVNAIYFKGSWAEKFNPRKTIKKRFYYTENDSTQVDMMTQKSEFRFGIFDDLDATTLELPYADSNLSMLIVLPNYRSGWKDVCIKLKYKSIFKISQRMRKTEVSVMLPKFKVDYAVELKEPLKQMGMTKMFSNAAEFYNMLEEPEDLKVSKVLHKAFIEVNEDGTEAAVATATTGYVVTCVNIQTQPKEFIADHPFIYFIWDKRNILFAGNIVKFD